jgi:4'-phosphopantetheinyl transferase
LSALPDARWRSPPEPLPEVGADVHVWLLRLDVRGPRLRALERLLAPEERGRACRFHFEIDRDRFIARRGLLRVILGRYLGRAPESLRLGEGEYGKPHLLPEGGLPDLRFSLSHSRGVALIAVSLGRDVGVDLEGMRADVLEDDIPERFFSPRELTALRALPPEEQLAAFFRCWTRKEAYIKALGLGLQLPLDSFDVSVGPDEPPALLGTRPDPEQATRWSLVDLSPGPEHAGALVVEKPWGSLRRFVWRGSGGPTPRMN